jgi:hypothetical protein
LSGNEIWRSTTRIPRVRVLANGSLLPGLSSAEVRSTNSYGANEFTFRAALPPREGATTSDYWLRQSDSVMDVQFSNDATTEFVSVIQGRPDIISVDPIRKEVEVRGRDLTAEFLEAPTQEAFANLSSSEVATLLAGRHGLDTVVQQTTTPCGRYYEGEHSQLTLNQFSRIVTEWDLLVYLARREEFEVYVAGGTFHFHPPDAHSLPVVLSIADLIELRLTRMIGFGRDIEVCVKSWNSRTEGCFTRSLLSTNSELPVSLLPLRYSIGQPNLTPDAALTIARQRIGEIASHEWVAEFSMPGEVRIQPGTPLKLQGTASAFDRLYYVEAVDRRIRPRTGFVQNVIARSASYRSDLQQAGVDDRSC